MRRAMPDPVPLVAVVRVHPAGGYAVVRGSGSGEPRPVADDAQQFGTVVDALRWIVAERPGHRAVVSPECANQELLYRSEARRLACVLDEARAWFDRNGHAMPMVEVIELGRILFPDRADELAAVLARDELPERIEDEHANEHAHEQARLRGSG